MGLTDLETLYLDTIRSKIEVLGNDYVHQFSRVKVALIQRLPCPSLGDITSEAILGLWTLRSIRFLLRGTTVVLYQARTRLLDFVADPSRLPPPVHDCSRMASPNISLDL